jgi:hypothetical protein
MSLNEWKISPLQGQTDYRKWSLDVKATAQLGGFWKAVLGMNSTTSTEASEIDKIEQREQKAVGLITRTVAENLKVELDEYRVPDSSSGTIVLKEPTAQQLWEYLKTKFEKKDGVSALLDLKLLTETKLVDDGQLEAQLNNLQVIRSRCAMNDIRLEDWQYAAFILIKLPETYQHIADALLAKGSTKDLKPEDVRAKILETEIRRKADADPAAHSLSAKPAAGKPKKPPPGQECFKCGKTGHWARRCRAKSKNKPNAGPSDVQKGKQVDSSLNVVENTDAESNSPLFCYFGAPESWLMDSGATDHMSPFGSDFKNYAVYAESRHTVVLGDGSTRLPLCG